MLCFFWIGTLPLVFFRNFSRFLDYISNTWILPSYLRDLSPLELLKYLTSYYLFSTRVTLFLLAIVSVIFLSKKLNLQLSIRQKRNVLISISSLSLMLVSLLFLTDSLHQAKNRGYWQTLLAIVEKSPHYYLYFGLAILPLALGQSTIFKDSKLAKGILESTLVALSSLPLLYDIPDVTRLWLIGPVLLFVTINLLKYYSDLFVKQIFVKILGYFLISITSICILISTTMLYFSLNGYYFESRRNHFQYMFIQKKEFQQIESIEYFQQKLLELGLEGNSDFTIDCQDGLFHVAEDKVFFDKFDWASIISKSRDFNAYTSSSTRVIGICNLDESQIEQLKELNERKLFLFGNSALLLLEKINS